MTVRDFLILQEQLGALGTIPPIGPSSVGIELSQLTLCSPHLLEDVPGFRSWRLFTAKGLLASLGEDFEPIDASKFSVLAVSFCACVKAGNYSRQATSELIARCKEISKNPPSLLPAMPWARERVERILPYCYSSEPFEVAEKILSYMCLLGFSGPTRMLLDDLAINADHLTDPTPLSSLDSHPPLEETSLAFLCGILNLAHKLSTDDSEADRFWARFQAPRDNKDPLLVIKAYDLMGSTTSSDLDLFETLGQVAGIFGVNPRGLLPMLPDYLNRRIRQARQMHLGRV